MKQWIVLYNKETLGMWRSYKWLWLTIVFMLLGVMNPVTEYYMPRILSSNGMSQEVIDTIARQSAPEVMMKTLSQYNTLGLLIVALAFMGIVAAERQNGSAVMTLVKPVSHLSYVTSKWAAMMSITLAAFAFGYAMTWYYDELLIGTVPFAQIAQSLLVYALWLVFAGTLALLFSCMMNATGAIAFLTLATLAALSLAADFAERYMKWSPGYLSAVAGDLVQGKGFQGSFWLPIAVTVALVAAMLFGAARLSALTGSSHRSAQ